MMVAYEYLLDTNHLSPIVTIHRSHRSSLLMGVRPRWNSGCATRPNHWMTNNLLRTKMKQHECPGNLDSSLVTAAQARVDHRFEAQGEKHKG